MENSMPSAVRRGVAAPLRIFSGLGLEFELLCYFAANDGGTIPDFVAHHALPDDVHARIHLGRLVKAGLVTQVGNGSEKTGSIRPLKTYRATAYARRCLEATKCHHVTQGQRLAKVLSD
jgi:hypothetical protein